MHAQCWPRHPLLELQLPLLLGGAPNPTQVHNVPVLHMDPPLACPLRRALLCVPARRCALGALSPPAMCKVCLLISPGDEVDMEMAGRAWKGGAYAHELRCHLWAEHLGLEGHGQSITPQDQARVQDPACEPAYQLWQSVAQSNAGAYAQVRDWYRLVRGCARAAESCFLRNSHTSPATSTCIWRTSTRSGPNWSSKSTTWPRSGE